MHSVVARVTARIIERSKDHGSEKLARPLALFVIEGGAINEIEHLVVSCSCLVFSGVRRI